MEGEALPAELIVKEGDDIDYRVVLAAYVLADIGDFCLCSALVFRFFKVTLRLQFSFFCLRSHIPVDTGWSRLHSYH